MSSQRLNTKIVIWFIIRFICALSLGHLALKLAFYFCVYFFLCFFTFCSLYYFFFLYLFVFDMSFIYFFSTVFFYNFRFLFKFFMNIHVFFIIMIRKIFVSGSWGRDEPSRWLLPVPPRGRSVPSVLQHPGSHQVREDLIDFWLNDWLIC